MSKKITNEQMAQEFMKYCANNYKRIYNGFSMASWGNRLTEDIFHDSLVKVHDSIIKRGFKIKEMRFSGQSFENYLFISTGNEIMQEGRQIKKNKGIVIESDSEFFNEKEPEYNFEDELEEEFNRISEDILVDDIFRNIKSKFSHLDCGLFEFYFRSGLGYRKLAEITGYSLRTVHLKVSKIKAHVITEFADRRLYHRIKN